MLLILRPRKKEQPWFRGHGEGLAPSEHGGRVVRTLDLIAINRSRVRILASPLSSATLGKLLTHILPLSPSSIIWYQPMGGDALRLGR